MIGLGIDYLKEYVSGKKGKSDADYQEARKIVNETIIGPFISHPTNKILQAYCDYRSRPAYMLILGASQHDNVIYRY